MLVVCSSCRGSAVTLSGTGAGGVGHTEIWIFGSILWVSRTGMESLIFKNSIFFTTANTETPAQDTGIEMKQVKVKQLHQAGLGNHRSKLLSNTWLKENRTCYRLNVILQGIFLALEEQGKMEKCTGFLKTLVWCCLGLFHITCGNKFALFLSSPPIWLRSFGSEAPRRSRHGFSIGANWSSLPIARLRSFLRCEDALPYAEMPFKR